MVRNTILGMCAFGIYEYIAIHRTNNTENTVIHSTLSRMKMDASLHRLAAESSSVLVHAGAGACAGFAESLVLIAWKNLVETQTPTQKAHNHKNAPRAILKQSLGYAALFGSYEYCRRLLEFSFYGTLQKQEHHILQALETYPAIANTLRTQNGEFDVTPLRGAFAFCAGGLAGQVYHVVVQLVQRDVSQHFRRAIRETWKTKPSFWPTGVCFLALEYGGAVTERVFEDQRSRL